MNQNVDILMTVGHRLKKEFLVWGRLVKFSHSVFALPFALSVVVILWEFVSFSSVFWIVVCLVSARTSAMGFNRLVDCGIDSQNPRTANRELPQGVVSSRSVVVLVTISSLVFFLGAAMLGEHCLLLAPFVLGFLLLYSYSKRFTDFSHMILGLSLALAPGGVWYALTSDVSWLPLPLMIGVLFWVAGFDILYSCQDYAFDRLHGLRSFPSTFGVPCAMQIAYWLHVVALFFFALFGVCMKLGLIYYCGVGIFALILLSQHRLVSPKDLSRIDQAFFTRNGLASVAFFIAVALDKLFQLG
ncbi:MAG: putative 4-hydroxybenzoate polyprenyltransferase [Bdellovibrionales bacterium]|nr:putative 4-hydroxybenzoate polyprenyltransferase [Bdellovibrionales bacterium]